MTLTLPPTPYTLHPTPYTLTAAEQQALTEEFKMASLKALGGHWSATRVSKLLAQERALSLLQLLRLHRARDSVLLDEAKLRGKLRGLLIAYSARSLVQRGVKVGDINTHTGDMRLAAEAGLVKLRVLHGCFDSCAGHVDVPGPGLLMIVAQSSVPDRMSCILRLAAPVPFPASLASLRRHEDEQKMLLRHRQPKEAAQLLIQDGEKLLGTLFLRCLPTLHYSVYPC